MPQQIYLANVTFGANATGYFQVLANTYQEAGVLATRYYEANAAAFLPNGEPRFVGQPSGHTNAIGNGINRLATVYVRDSSITEANKSYEIIVNGRVLDSANQVFGQYFVISTTAVRNQY